MKRALKVFNTNTNEQKSNSQQQLKNNCVKMNFLNLAVMVLSAGFLLASCEKDEKLPVKANIKGGEVSGVWERNGTYTIEGHVFIPKGQSLVIQEGVTVIMADETIGTEFIVSGNLYIKGTESNPVTFTVPTALRTEENAMTGLWGGILCDSDVEEVLIKHAILEYAGALTTENSPSVERSLYKGSAGERVPALWSINSNTRIVVTNSVIRNVADDCFYFEGGKIIVMNNIFHTSGNTGGEAVNIKSGVTMDAAFNLIYSANTNAFKLSNSGDRTPQAEPYVYNNTILNTGWRRPSTKGGSIWMEKQVNAKIFNNLLVNCRYGIKFSKADNRTEYDYNFYYGHNQLCVDQFQTSSDEVVRGANDIASTLAGENNPLFVNYPLDTDMHNAIFNNAWDFRLKSGSPAIGKGKATVNAHFLTNGLSIGGEIYRSPAASTTIGAFGVKQ